MKEKAFKVIALLLVLQVSGLFVPLLAGAAMVGTSEVLRQEGQRPVLDETRKFLARAEVRHMLLAHGVDPGDVEARLDGLTAGEIQRLEAGMATLPAGGDEIFVVIGVVFFVLLILEVVGVIDIFKKV